MARRRCRSEAERLARRRALKAERMRRWRRGKLLQKRLRGRLRGRALISDYDGLIAAIVHRRHALGLSQLAVDQIAGLADGYTGKVEANVRRLGMMSLGLILQALGLKLAPVPGEPPRIVRARRKPRRRRT